MSRKPCGRGFSVSSFNHPHSGAASTASARKPGEERPPDSIGNTLSWCLGSHHLHWWGDVSPKKRAWCSTGRIPPTRHRGSGSSRLGAERNGYFMWVGRNIWTTHSYFSREHQAYTCLCPPQSKQRSLAAHAAGAWWLNIISFFLPLAHHDPKSCSTMRSEHPDSPFPCRGDLARTA